MLSCLASPKRAEILGFQIFQNEIVAGHRKRTFYVTEENVLRFRNMHTLLLTFAQNLAQNLRRQALAWTRLVQKSILKKRQGK